MDNQKFIELSDDDLEFVSGGNGPAVAEQNIVKLQELGIMPDGSVEALKNRDGYNTYPI